MGPILWAQMTGPDPNEYALLSLRRWFEGVTLCSPKPVPSIMGFWVWLVGLAVLLAVVLVMQGPRRAMAQVVDIRGHVRLLGRGKERLQASGWMLTFLIGGTVLAWSVNQIVHFSEERRLDDLVLLSRSRSVVELAVEQSTLAMLTPLRDVGAMGDILVLVVVLGLFLLRRWSDRIRSLDDPYREMERPLPWWAMACWVCCLAHAAYRLVLLVINTDGMPIGGYLGLEPVLVPLVMLGADGAMMAWVLSELRGTKPRWDSWALLDRDETIRLWLVSMLVCLVSLPSRYVGALCWLLLFVKVGSGWETALVDFLRGFGLVMLQGMSILGLGMAAAVAWGGRRPGGCFASYLRLLGSQGGRLVVLWVLGAGAVFLSNAVAYLSVMSLPKQPWVLLAADSYSHYASLLIGVFCLSTVLELGVDAMPRAALATVPEEPEGDEPSGSQGEWARTGAAEGTGLPAGESPK